MVFGLVTSGPPDLLARSLAVFERPLERFEGRREVILEVAVLRFRAVLRTARRFATPRFFLRPDVAFLRFFVADFLLWAILSRSNGKDVDGRESPAMTCPRLGINRERSGQAIEIPAITNLRRSCDGP